MQEVSTASKVKRLVGKFSHTVIGWQGLPRNVGDHVESPEIELCGHKWKLRIFPGGSALKHKKFISVYLANRSSSSISASYKLFLRNQNTNVDVELFASAGVKTFEGQGKIDGWGRDRFYEKDNFTEESGFYINDTIIFTVEVVVYGDIEHQSTFSRKGFTLDQDICSLFHKRNNTDLVVKVASKKYHLHKCILAARSPVFQAMFSYPTLEMQSGQLNLEDDDPGAIEVFLQFLYTDFVSDETLNRVSKELLIVASKYQVTLLTISMNEFAYIYGTPHFQSEVKRYVFNHLTAVQNGQEYNALNESERLFLQNQLELNNIQLERKEFMNKMKQSSEKFQCNII